MSNLQDPAAASAPFDSRARGDASRTLAQGEAPGLLAQGVASRTLAQGEAPGLLAQGVASRTLAQGEPREIAIVATRFAFEPARVAVTEGERVRLVVTSGDGVHGVEIKKFKVNKKIPRGGEPVTIELVAATAGEYPILCSEYCGNGHEDMKGTLVVSAKTP